MSLLAAYEHTCPQCGSTYWISSEDVSTRETGSVNCYVCGVELISWNDTRTYKAALKHREEWPPRKDE